MVMWGMTQHPEREKSLQKIQEILQILTTNRIVRKTLPKPSPGEMPERSPAETH